MWGKTNVYPYHRKIIDTDRRGFSGLVNFQHTKEKILEQVWGKNVLLMMGMGILLSRAQILGELMPFGIAFLGAVAVTRKNILSILMAIVLGTYTVAAGLPLYLNIGVLIVLAVIFQTSPQVLKGHWLALPSAIFAVNFVIKAGGYLFFEPGVYYWAIALVESLLAAGITVILVYTFTNIAEKGLAWDKLVPEEMACILVICLGLVIGLAELSIWELSLKAIVSKFAILIGALIYGPGAGAIIGSMVGVIPGGDNVMTPAFAGILAFSGVLAGVFRQFHKLGVLIGFILGNLIFTVYLADQLTVIYYLGETMLAGIALLLLPLGAVKLLSTNEDTGFKLVGNEETVKVKGPELLVKQRVKELSQIFREIARTFEETVQEKKGVEGVVLIVENIRNKLCRSCSLYKKCWHADGGETAAVIGQMVMLVKDRGKIAAKDLPDNFKSLCCQRNEFVLTLMCSYDAWQVNAYWQRKLREQSELVPQQLKGISEIMDNLVEKVEHEGQGPKFWERELLRLCMERGIQLKGIKVFNKPNEGLEIIVTQTNCDSRFDCSETVAVMSAELLAKNMKVKKLQCDFQQKKGSCRYKIMPALQFKVAVGKAYTAKTGSPISGDSFSLLPLSEGKYSMLLSDGMGTGQKAKLESNTTIALLEHLLESGFDRETAVKTINTILILRSKEESFATLDMAIIDLYSGEVELTKIGAVPSFIKRGSRVGIIRASSLPIGILDNVESVTFSEQLQVGDIIVMVSDGILEADQKLVDKESWVKDLLTKLSTDDPQEIADQILFQARILAAEKSRDDMTVLVGRIDSRLH